MEDVASDLHLDFKNQLTNDPKYINDSTYFVVISRQNNSAFDIFIEYDITASTSLLWDMLFYRVYEEKITTYLTLIQTKIEKQIMKTFYSKDVDIQITYQIPPKITDLKYEPDSNLINFPRWIPSFFFIGFTIPIVIFIYQIVLENEKGMRNQLRILGLFDGAYILSWLTDGLIVSFIKSIIVLIFIYSNNSFTALSYAPPSILFVIFITYGFSLYSFGIFLSSFLSNSKSAVGLGLGLIIIGGATSISFGFIGSDIFRIYSYDKLIPIGILISLVPFLK
ncbi:hypothetical protein CYY_010040 [Polysphondylium violaceum]|uniref:ABC-2 type transporter transmembrane domain-containing protein n=1 Tax=Polysphondylium violaceum TaxID=133409 RepID=A0A8J4PJF8_9MYCE|nr:hypothetical protein CYY_010040 [Polysphondylium violaceum]